MDVLKLIEKQVDDIKSEGHSAYLDLILNHLDRAENYYLKGQKDEHYYNDVVYRTNQAFEGALKEAYKVLQDKSDEEIIKTTPFQIEKFLKEGDVFKDRVLSLFENYRQDWRNKTTHDYKLILDEHEAFLALMNVCSFVHLLLKQIQEKLAFTKELQKESNDDLVQEIIKNKSDSLTEKTLKLLARFISSFDQNEKNLKEIEINGKLNAFLTKSSNELTILREPKFTIGRMSLRPDFVIESQNDKLIIEVKRRLSKSGIKAGVDQLASYMTTSGITNGILYYASAEVKNNEVTINTHNVIVNDIELKVHVIY